MLNVKNVTKSFGALYALKNVSFHVNEGEVVGLIGPNGAGKTTLANVICGVYKCDSGMIEFNGLDITKKQPYEICKIGICRTYQIPQPFPDMTALANVAVAVLGRRDKSRMSFKDVLHDASHYLEFVGLLRKRDVLARDLTLYEQRALELARALATMPKLLIIDEVMAGLNPAESTRAIELINKARDEFNLTIIWIEHVMKIIMNAAERVIVLSYGEKIAEGSPVEISRDMKVIRAYLGEKYASG